MMTNRLPHLLPCRPALLPQHVSSIIAEKDQERDHCRNAACPSKARFACPGCGAPAPDSGKLRTAFLCQHALWTTLAPLLPGAVADGGGGGGVPGATGALQ